VINSNKTNSNISFYQTKPHVRTAYILGFHCMAWIHICIYIYMYSNSMIHLDFVVSHHFGYSHKQNLVIAKITVP
jgi:hypothetical protein